MPSNTTNLKPVIVYLPPEVHDQLAQVAKERDRTMSYIARTFIMGALERGTPPRPSRRR